MLAPQKMNTFFTPPSVTGPTSSRDIIQQIIGNKAGGATKVDHKTTNTTNDKGS